MQRIKISSAFFSKHIILPLSLKLCPYEIKIFCSIAITVSRIGRFYRCIGIPIVKRIDKHDRMSAQITFCHIT